MSIEINTTAGYLIHLIKNVIEKTKPDEKPDSISWESVYKLAEFHKVSNIAFDGVGKLDSKPDADIYKKWKEAYDKAIARDILQRREYAHLCNVFSASNIRVLPLKGCIMKRVYPRTYYRVMSDLDFLIDEENDDAVNELMLKEKYECESTDYRVHASYHKPPILSVEIHNTPIPAQYALLNDYYKDIFNKCSPSSDNPLIYEMTNEDFYIYQMAHLYKHYSNGGTGIRSIIDIYLLNHSDTFNLDREKVDSSLKLLELTSFESDIRVLSEVWFGNASATKETMESSQYILTSGVYGTTNHSMVNGITQAIKKQGRIRSFFHRLFLDYDTLKTAFPILEKYPVLLPFCQLKRIFTALITKPGKCIYIFKIFMKKTK